jgi:hypothetical protein
VPQLRQLFGVTADSLLLVAQLPLSTMVPFLAVVVTLVLAVLLGFPVRLVVMVATLSS